MTPAKAPGSLAPIDDMTGGGMGVLADPGLSERDDPADLIAQLSALEVTFPPKLRVSPKCLLLASTIYKDFAEYERESKHAGPDVASSRLI